jgi:endoglucanase
MEKLLESFVEADSISGYEDAIRDLIKKELKPHVDEIRIDKIGNIIAKRGKGSPKIMFISHMDELGMMVKHITKEGFIYFELIGGWDDRVIPAMKVKIHGSKGPIIGVIGVKPPHIMEKEELKTPIKAKDLYIDVGAKSDKEVSNAGISVGDSITRAGEFSRLLGSRVTGHGFDNRVGCTVMVEALKRAKGFKGTLYGVGSVQEETGIIGARGAIYGVDPDIVIGLDATISGGTPDVKPTECDLILGKGPVMLIKDGYAISDKKIKKWISQTARKAKIPFQKEVTSGGATDSSLAPVIKEGIPSGSILVATRYVHSPVEVVDMKDVENAVKLTVECMKTANKYF